MKFLDEAKIFVQSGHGGRGAVAFRREKFVEFGGPWGGDGGRGGHVFAEAAANLNTLIDYRYRQHFKAARGGDGQGKDRHGANAEDLVLRVPPGTVILAEDKETVVADLTRPGQRAMLAKGGDGGRGNAAFKSPTNRAPRQFEPGWPGEERWLWLRLKLIADVGIVGLPNAGKSTFLAAATRARPKIAPYPFTTLHPNLGVAAVSFGEIVLADIPGLIEGAHEGKGIGDRFLGHVERCRALLHLVDATETDVQAAYRTVRRELKAYGAGLAAKPEIVALNKCDLLDADTASAKQKALRRSAKKPVHILSAATGQGRDEVVAALAAIVAAARAGEAKAVSGAGSSAAAGARG